MRPLRGRATLRLLAAAATAASAPRRAHADPPAPVTAQAVTPPPGAAGAGPARVRLAVVRGAGAEDCPDGRAFAQEITRRMGRDPFDPAAPRSLEVLLARAAGGPYVARIVVWSAPGAAPGARELTSDAPDCALLAAGVALALALTIDPDARLAPAAPARSGNAFPGAPDATAPRGSTVTPANRAAAPGPVVPPPGARRAAPAPTRPARGPLAWDDAPRVDLLASAAFGLLPRPALALALGVVPPRTGPGRFTVGALLLPEARTDDRRFSFGMTAAWAGYCLALASARVGGEACGLFVGGLVHAVSHVLEPVRPGDYPWLGFGLAVRGSLRLIDPVSLVADVTGLLPVLRQRFVVLDPSGAESATPVYEQAPVALTVGGAVRVRFW